MPVCEHINKIDIERDGDCVCTDCGLVLEQLLLPFQGFVVQVEPKHVEMHEFIADIADKANIPNNVTHYAVKYYDQLYCSLIRKFSKRTIASYAIYETLKKFETPKLPEWLEYFSGVSRKHIWRVEAHLAERDETVHDPGHYVGRYCDLLGLIYSEQLLVREAVDCLNSTADIPLGNLHCNCLVAVVIYLCCQVQKKEITLAEICSTCTISATSIHRVIRQMKLYLKELEQEKPLAWIAKHLSKQPV